MTRTFAWQSVRLTRGIQELLQVHQDLIGVVVTQNLRHPRQMAVAGFPSEMREEILEKLDLREEYRYFSEVDTNIEGMSLLTPAEGPPVGTMITGEVAQATIQEIMEDPPAKKKREARKLNPTLNKPTVVSTHLEGRLEFLQQLPSERAQWQNLLELLLRSVPGNLSFLCSPQSERCAPVKGRVLIQVGLTESAKIEYTWEDYQVLRYRKDEAPGKLIPFRNLPETELGLAAGAWKEDVVYLFLSSHPRTLIPTVARVLRDWVAERFGLEVATRYWEDYLKTCAARASRNVGLSEAQARETVASTSAQLARLAEQISQLNTQREHALRTLRDYEGGDQNAHMTSVLREVAGVSGVTGVTEYRNKICLTTGQIFIKYEEYTYDMGNYFIEISPSDQVVRIKSIQRWNQGSCHPHVENGVPCFGNIRDQISQLISRKQYRDLALLLVTYLATYNPGDHYLTPHNILGLGEEDGVEDPYEDPDDEE